MLEKIQLLLNLQNDLQDELLVTLISLCKEEAYNYCSLPEYDSKLDFIVIQMVIERYNRMGSEGTTSQNASGVSATYSDFYSDKVVKMLQKHRKVRMV